jgi:hypothetical protein
MPNERPELARALAAVVRRELAATKGALPTP